MTNPSKPGAIVVGAGIAGLAAAIALVRAGYAVRVVERAAELAPIGAALSIWANAVDGLDQLGVGQAFRAVATPIDQMGVFTRAGRPIIGPRQVTDQPYVGATAFMVTRAALQAVLLAAIDPALVTLGVTVSAIGQDAGGVSITLASGEVIRSDLAIVADGIWSATAKALIGGEPAHAGYGGVLALSDAVLERTGDGCAHEYWGVGERFGLFDIGAERRYWFYMRNEDSPDEARRLTHDQVAGAARGWIDAIGQAVAATPADRLIPFSIHAKPPPARLGRGRVLCIGDAAHAMEPNLGQGGCQSIEDAVALGAVARMWPVEAILPNFEQLRLKRIARFVKQSAEGARPAHSRSAMTRGLLKSALGIAPAGLTNRVIAGMHLIPDYAALSARAGNRS